MVKKATYFVEKYKFICFTAFYILLGLLVHISSPLAHPRTSVKKAAISNVMPYTVLHPYNPSLAAVQAAKYNSSLAAQAAVNGVTWPIHGMVTTEFGDSDFPYQSSHTGIDISSGRPSGTTAVAAFKTGIITSVVHSGISYGNHVIIDHGNGLTSLYGHLYSISVNEGDKVTAGQIIGTEGSTGAATGPHVHFEIRQDNIPQNPRNFVQGNP